MKIKLIAPARKTECKESLWDLKTFCKFIGTKAMAATLTLPLLAALTPSDVEVVLTDEVVEPIDFDEKIDLVGITGITALIPRSYEIADEYRKKGVPVVMGGVHVSMLPEEAIQHCDSVVIGEAEGIWERVIRDAEKKNLQRFYYAPKFPNLFNALTPRWDLVKHNEYCCFTIHTGRGCPNDCEFCTVRAFFGSRYRHKSIERVVEEITFLQKINPKKPLFFSDDNFLASPKYSEELLNKMIPLKINHWWCQAAVDMLQNDKILGLMYEAGCRMIIIGFESLSQKTLVALNKSKINRVENYKETVNRIHSHQMGALGIFILGNDTDEDTTFEEIISFIDETNMAFPNITILTPYVGSRLYEKFKSEGRILSKNWGEYNGETACFQPNRLSVKELEEKRVMIYKNIYGYGALYKRLSNLWKKKVLINTKQDFHRLFTMPGGVGSFLTRILAGEKEKKNFMVKSFCSKNGLLSANSILLGINFHEYACNLRK